MHYRTTFDGFGQECREKGRLCTEMVFPRNNGMAYGDSHTEPRITVRTDRTELSTEAPPCTDNHTEGWLRTAFRTTKLRAPFHPLSGHARH